MGIEDIMIDGRSLSEWDEAYSNGQETPEISNENIIKMGIIRPEEREPQSIDTQDNGEKEYQKLSVGGTLKDIGQTIGAEALRFIAPKKGGFVGNLTGNKWTEDDLYQHESQTRIGEASKYLYRYTAGTLAFLAGGEVAGGLAIGAGAINKSIGLIKAGEGIKKILGTTALIKNGANATKAAKVGTWIANKSIEGAIGGALSDFALYDGEGHMADVFGVTDNPVITLLQTNENDNQFQERLKNSAEGLIMGIPINLGVNGLVVAKNYLKSLHKVVNTATEEGAVEATKEFVMEADKMNRFLKTSELSDVVEKMQSHVDVNGGDVDQLIMNHLAEEQWDNAKKMAKTLQSGEDIFVHEDGTWAIKVNNWDDAYKVPEQEYAKQMKAVDKINGEEGTGNAAINHQDQAIKETWTNRGWIGANEELNSKNAQKVANNYVDKWNMNNKVKVEFVDGLTNLKGEPIEATTLPASNKGKKKPITKAAQTKIDKKKLEIQQLQDKITMLEGGNGEVTDPLDILKEKLRIAQNELKDLNKLPQPEIDKNITIKIDKNAKNPYAALRMELEHAKDMAQNSVPKGASKNGSGTHFSRYVGDNEAEVAPSYTHKKATGKNKYQSEQPSIDDMEITDIKVGDDGIPDIQVATKENKPLPYEGSATQELERQAVEAEQLKLDFASAEEAASKMSTGEAVPNTVEGIDKAISKAAETEIPVTGTTWQDLFNDTDNIPQDIKELFDSMDEKSLQNFFSEDRQTLTAVNRKQLFSAKVMSFIQEKMESLGYKNANITQRNQMIDALEYLKEYQRALASGFGEGLNAQKPINEIMETFGTKRFSQLNRDTISNFFEMLNEISKGLEFTRGNIQQNKQEIINQLTEMNPKLMTVFQEAGEQYMKTLDDIITNIAKNGKEADLGKLNKQLQDVFTNSEYDALCDALKLAKDKKSWWKTFRNWTNQYGGIESYYVHNLLSSPASFERNVFSGIVNTIYFPLAKTVGGWLGNVFKAGDTEFNNKMINEGIRTYHNQLVSMKEAFDLGWQSFLKGEGKLGSFTVDSLDNANGTVRGFHDMTEGDKNFFHWVQNVHSIMTRSLGASDEFLRQLNYRALARNKVDEAMPELVKLNNKVGDDAWYKQKHQELFDSYFEANTGKPTDPDLYSQTSEILYQNPLSGALSLEGGKAYDVRTGNILERGQEATQTVAMKLGQNLQNLANQNLVAKIFFPFVKTGVNILQENLDHNIVYAFCSPSQQALLKSNTAQGALARGKVAFGMFSFTMATTMAMGGMITGSLPADKKERQALLATGWRPYSFRVGNQYVSYQGFEPLHTILGFAADSWNLMTAIASKDDEEKFGKYFVQGGSALFNNFFDKAAFRQGIQSFSSIMELDESNLPNIEKAVASPFGGFLMDSSGIKYVSTLGSRDAKAPEGVTQRIFNQYFNRGLGEYRRNAFGEKQTITNAMLWTQSEQPNNTPEDIELNRLAEEGYKPSQVSEVINGYSFPYRNFTDENGRNAYDLMMEDLSKSGLREAVRELVTSDYYNSLSADGINGIKEKLMGIKYSSSDETKVNALNDVFLEYNDIVRNDLTSKHPNLRDKNGRTLEEALEEADRAKEAATLGEEFNELY